MLNHLHFLSFFDHSFIMPRNWQEKILVRIVRLLAEGYSQGQAARMFDVSHGCVNKILRRNRDTGRHSRMWGRTHAQKVGSQALEALCIQWWVSLYAVHSDGRALVQARGGGVGWGWWMRASSPRMVTVAHQTCMGCHPLWWEWWTGGAAWNPQPPMLH